MATFIFGSSRHIGALGKSVDRDSGGEAVSRKGMVCGPALDGGRRSILLGHSYPVDELLDVAVELSGLD